VLTEAGPVELEVPRDWDSSFEPKIVAKRQRRLSGVDDMVISLSARGLTTGEIAAHPAEVYGAEVSKQTISTITERVMEGMAEWQNRPLDPVYPVLFIDCIHVKIREGNVANRPIYVAMGVTVDDTRDILGLWAGEHGDGEGAKYWLRVLSELKNRGVQDVLIVVCDGLKHLPDSIEQVWPQTIVQTCVVHLLRNAYAYASRKDWAEIAKDLKPVYTAPSDRLRSTDSQSSVTNGRNAIPRSSGAGPMPGRSSCRSYNSTMPSGRLSTRPTPSKVSTPESAGPSRPVDTFRPRPRP